MSQTQNTSTALTLADRVKAIDLIIERAESAFADPGSFAREIAVAQAVVDFRAALTPEVMAPVMALMNTSFGFKTDRDPRLIDPKTDKPFVPYSMEVVRDVFVDARMRGFRGVGNEFNIIAGNFYAAKAGFERKVRTHPKVTDFADNYGMPRMVGEKGAVIECVAEWKLDGVPQSLKREIPVRVNSSMGVDAIIGKAKRKLFAAVYERLTGRVTPEGEVGDEPINVQASATTADSPPMPPAGTGANDAKEPGAPKESGAPPQPPQLELEKVVCLAGYTFAHFAHWARSTGNIQDADSLPGFDAVPGEVCARLLRARKGLLAGLAKSKTAMEAK